MNAYRVVWSVICGALGVVGTAVASAWSIPASLLLFVVCGGAIGAMVMKLLPDAKGTNLPTQYRRHKMATSSVLGGGGTVAFIGLVMLLGARGAFLLLTLIAGGSPYAIHYGLNRLVRHARSSDPSSDPARPATRDSDREPTDRAATPQLARLLSDDGLCMAWRASISALERANSPSQRLRVVQERGAYLDELERRNAQGLAAWLASGARAAGDPSRFVRGQPPSHSTIDWDHMIRGTDT